MTEPRTIPANVRVGSRLCEKSREPRKRRIVFSIAVSRPRLPVQLVSVSMKLRQMFYTQIERRTFHTAWVKNGSVRSRAARPFYPGGLNRSTQHFILKERWSVV